MEKLEKKQYRIRKERSRKKLHGKGKETIGYKQKSERAERTLTAMQTALKDKKLEFTINGKTWKRNSLRSKSFYNE